MGKLVPLAHALYSTVFPLAGRVPHRIHRIKVGVHLKAIFTPLKIGQMKISCLHFKQYKNPPFIAQINDLGCFMNFWVIFRYIWKEIIFLEGLVKLKEIRNVEDLVKF